MAPLLAGGGVRSYKLAFVVEMILVNACLTWLVAREVGRSEKPDRAPLRIAWYSIYFMVLCPMNITRYDLVPTLAAFGSATLLASGRVAAGGLVSGIGVLIKLVPGLVVLPTMAEPGPWRSESNGVGDAHRHRRSGCDRLVVPGRREDRSFTPLPLRRGLEIGSSYSSAYMLAHEVAGVKILAFTIMPLTMWSARSPGLLQGSPR